MSDPMKQSTGSALIAASDVEGKPVFDLHGEKLGTLKEIYLGKVSGEVEFAVLAFGGARGVLGEKHHPLPWSSLDYDAAKDGFVVDIDKDALEASPAYENDFLSGADHGWGAEVRTYYSSLGTPH